MARYQLAATPRGVIQDRRGDVRGNKIATLTQLDGTTPVTIYSAETGSTKVDPTAGKTYTDDRGELQGWIDQPGDYLLTVDGRTLRFGVPPLSVESGGLYVPASALLRPKESRYTIFPAGHGWTTVAGAGTVTDDTADYVLGSQSVKLVTDGAGGNSRIGKASLSPTIDLTSGYFKLVVKVSTNDATKLDKAFLYASSDNFAANWQSAQLLETAAEGRTQYLLDDEWAVFTVSKSDFAPGAGSINWAAVNSVRLSFFDKGGNQVTAHWNLLATVPPPASAVVSLTFDDGWAGNYTKARPVLDKYGFPATLYTLAGAVDMATAGIAPTHMPLSQVAALARNGGWEIASHAYSKTLHDNRYTSVSLAEVEADFIAMKKWLSDNGFRGGPHFAWPGGVYNSALLKLARKHFASARTTHSQTMETFPPADPGRLRRYNCSGLSGATITARIDKAIANKDWLILNFHEIVTNLGDVPAAAGLECTAAAFMTAMDYLASQNVRVKAMGDVLAGGVA